MPLNFKDLSADTLGHIGEGSFGLAIDREIARAVTDLDNRGADEKVRTVVIQIKMYWDNEAKRYKLEPSVQAKLPAQQAYTTEAKLEFDPKKKTNVMNFNADSVVADQSTIVN